MYIAAGIINISADCKYRCVTSKLVFVEINTNPNMVIIGKATNNPAHFESKCLDNNDAPTITEPDIMNCKIS